MTSLPGLHTIATDIQKIYTYDVNVENKIYFMLGIRLFPALENKSHW